jgi:hypothetical protein
VAGSRRQLIIWILGLFDYSKLGSTGGYIPLPPAIFLKGNFKDDPLRASSRL